MSEQDATELARAIVLLRLLRDDFTAFSSAFEQDSPHSIDGIELAERIDAFLADNVP